MLSKNENVYLGFKNTLVWLTVSSIGLLDTAVIGDVFSLSIDPVEAEAQLGEAVVAVLADDALGLPDVLFFGYGVPPIHQIAWKSINISNAIFRESNTNIYLHFSRK